jgi:hypothetical protein
MNSVRRGASAFARASQQCSVRACQKSSQPAGKSASAGSSKAEDEVVTTQWGSPAFRVLNFELYAKPTGWNKVLAYAGSTAFVGIMAYLTFSDGQ